MTTASTLIQRALVKMGSTAYFSSTATGGGTTTFVDSTLANIYQSDELVNGTVIITKSTVADHPPINEWSRITAITTSSGTLTFGALTHAVTAGDICMVVLPKLPIAAIVDVTNSVLDSLGPIALVDTSITTVSTHTEYELPLTIKAAEPLRIEYQGYINDADDNAWITLPRDSYYIVPATAGTKSKIVFVGDFVADHDLKIWYLGSHPLIDSYEDTIHEAIPVELAAAKLAVELFNWGGVDQDQRDAYQKCLNDAVRAEQLFRVHRPARPTNFFTFGRGTTPRDTVPSPIA